MPRQSLWSRNRISLWVEGHFPSPAAFSRAVFQSCRNSRRKNSGTNSWRITMKWTGVMPAITTCFTENYEVDHAFVAEHCRWLVANGCTGVVALGSLGEGATLTFDEKVAILKTCTSALKGSAFVIAAISALATSEAVALAKAAEAAGCNALMILPPYVYKGDWREMKTHIATVLKASKLPCMLYNNPVAYGTDFTPEQIQELANEHANLQAVKESSTDVRRVTGIRALTG